MSFQRARVPAGFAFGALYLALSQPTPRWFLIGLTVAAAGLALRVWAAGHLKKWRALTTSGPYRWTRNPLYLGSFVMGLGFAAASANLLLVIVFVISYVSIYVPVMKREEGELERGYGEDFQVYRHSVPLFLPIPTKRESGPGSPRVAQEGNFQWRRVIFNREYNAVIGFAVIAVAVWLKMSWS